MRYTYIGDKLTRPEMKGAALSPVRQANGRCIVSRMGTMLVQDRRGGRHIVLRRRLRVNKVQRELFPAEEIVPRGYEPLLLHRKLQGVMP